MYIQKSNRHYSSRLSYTPFILPLYFQQHTTFVYKRVFGSSVQQHVHQITNVTSYQPILLFSSYHGYLKKMYANRYIKNNKPELMTIQLQSLLKNPTITKKLYPLYRNIWQDILQEEQHYYRSRPTQSLGLLAPLLSHRQTFGVLTKFYLGKMNKEEIMQYASLYPSKFYTWRILQGLSNQETYMQPFKHLVSMVQEQKVPSMQYVYTKKLEAQNNIENKEVTKTDLSTFDKHSLQQNMHENTTDTSAHTSSISLQDMKQIINQVTKELEKQYRYEAKRYGR